MDNHDIVIAKFLEDIGEYLKNGVKYHSSILISIDPPDVFALYEALKSKGLIE